MVTSYGLVRNAYAKGIPNQLTMDDLFLWFYLDKLFRFFVAEAVDKKHPTGDGSGVDDGEYPLQSNYDEGRYLLREQTIAF